jgi:hypothetical protein
MAGAGADVQSLCQPDVVQGGKFDSIDVYTHVSISHSLLLFLKCCQY